jgi:hypothetical protein
MSSNEKIMAQLNDALQFVADDDNPKGSVAVEIWAVRGALELLREQEPHVLTLDEAVDGSHVYYVEFQYHMDCGWVKCDFDRMYVDGEVAMLFLRDKTFYQQKEDYGTLWRLWSARPTYDQRLEAKWE